MAIPTGRNGLIEDEEEIEWVDLDGDVDPHLSLLAAAARSGNVEALRIALDTYSGTIDDPVEDGDTVLHLSCLYGNLPCVQLLLERGASLETKDEEGGIPLHDACAGGYTEIVQSIIHTARGPGNRKQMLDTVDAEGDTPLHHAARGEHLDVVNLLLSLGASPSTTNVDGKTPAELADPETQVRSVLEAATASDPVVCST